MSYRFEPGLRERLARHLAAHPRQRHTDPALRRAAVVLIAADAGDGNAALLLTLRPMGMRRHANQFAFPGGRLDQGETATQAALRETREEINLNLSPDMLLGRLDDFPTRSGFIITPLVAWA
ncbi:MAG: NUDIX hydrolase, partial [Burkholderiales bacterium]